MDKRTKYPRTYHIDFSECLSKDDKFLESIDSFLDKNVSATIKLDGENTTIYSDGYCHARSIDSKDHFSRHWVKSYSKIICSTLPNGYRICGENMFTKHSIEYINLSSYFYAFSVWNDKNECLSIEDTLYLCKEMNIEYVPVIYNEKFDYRKLQTLFRNVINNGHEGIVIRNNGKFHYNEFSDNVCKAVRRNHVQTDEHWFNSKLVQNKIINGLPALDKPAPGIIPIPRDE